MAGDRDVRTFHPAPCPEQQMEPKSAQREIYAFPHFLSSHKMLSCPFVFICGVWTAQTARTLLF